MKRRISVVLSFVLVFVGVFSNLSFVNAAASNYNYGEALQKVIMFYEFQRSGQLSDDIRNNWRGDSGLQDGADSGLDLTGGWYDAGDHVKFNLPMSYSTAMLAWAAYECEEELKAAGQLDYLKKEIKWATDYFIKCHPEKYVYYYQVGDGNKDHAWWGPAEVMQMARPSYKVTKSSPGSTVVAETAAALASASIIFKDDDPEYSALCLKHAKELYQFADETRSDAGYTAASGFYNSWSGFIDELAWAASWLYLATENENYLNKAETDASNFGKEQQTSYVGYKWAQCWDDVHYGAQILLAKITNKDVYKDNAQRSLDYWTTGTDTGEKITYSPKGLAWLSKWGSLRYSTTMAFMASVYADWNGCPSAKKDVYNNFAKKQIDYALGSSGRSYVVGFGQNPPKHPHHRTAHSSWSNSLAEPNNHRHVLVGALVGGPDSSDGYADDIMDYVSNEVACDYNAGFVGALAKLQGKFGGNPINNLDAIEKIPNDEIYIEASINSSASNFTEIKATLYNKTGWPARVTDKLSFKYFMDLSEIYEAGYTCDDITTSLVYGEGGVVSKLKVWDEENYIYYVEVDYSGVKIYPGGQSEHKKQTQFRIAAPTGTNFWNPNNDFSFNGLTDDPAVTQYIPVYDEDTLLFGKEVQKNKAPQVEIISPLNDDVFKKPSNENPIIIKANAISKSGNPISEVTFFENGEKIKTVKEAPYQINFVPKKEDNIVEKIEITAKAIDDSGLEGTSKPVNITVQYEDVPNPVVSISSPENNIVYEKVSSSNPIEFKADASITDGEITRIKYYVNDEEINEDYYIDNYKAEWYPTDFPDEDGVTTYTVKAVAISSYNTTAVDVGEFKVKFEKPPIELLVESYNNSRNLQSNAIDPHIQITNKSNEPIDVSKLKIKYFYTIDGEKQQNFWCDHAAIKGNGKYKSVSSVNGLFAKVDGENYVLEIGIGSKSMIEPNETLIVNVRFAKQDWSNYNQANDYSFMEKASNYEITDKINVYYNDVLISGK